MYEINLDFDPTTVGFDPLEITQNSDGTYTVTRRFVWVTRRTTAFAGDFYSLEAYCPSLTDNVTILCYQITDHKGRTEYGVKYWTNDNDECCTERRSLSNSIMNYWYPIGAGRFNRSYDTNMNEKQETAAAFCVSKLNGHPNNINSVLEKYFKEHHIVFGKSAPTSPEEDPFLPDEFKKMIGMES